MYLVKHRGIYHARLYRSGRYVERSTGTRDRKKAEAWVRKQEKLLRQELLEPSGAKTAKQLSYFEGEVLAHYATSPRNTREGMRYGLRHFKRICGDLHLQDISFATVEKFKRTRLAEGRRPSTVNNNLRCLSAALTYAKDLEYIDVKPKIKLVKANRENPRTLSTPEVESLLKKAGGRLMERFVRVALHTGLRPGEIIHLPWSEVDLEAGVIHVRHGGDGPTKGRRDRAIPMHPDLRLFLADLSPKDGRVVPLSKNQVQDWFHRQTTFTAHRLRHTFASRYIQNGGNVTKLQKILGHASVQTTMIYVHLNSEDLRAEIEELPSLPVARP
jgi:integrase/recombinase XerD